jgi:excisionase family DNA binding protein
MTPAATLTPRLYRIPDAMRLLSMSRSVIYEQFRSGRLRSVHQGRTRLIPDTAIRDYIALLETESEGANQPRQSAAAEATAACTGARDASAG